MWRNQSSATGTFAIPYRMYRRMQIINVKGHKMELKMLSWCCTYPLAIDFKLFHIWEAEKKGDIKWCTSLEYKYTQTKHESICHTVHGRQCTPNINLQYIRPTTNQQNGYNHYVDCNIVTNYKDSVRSINFPTRHDTKKNKISAVHAQKEWTFHQLPLILTYIGVYVHTRSQYTITMHTATHTDT